MNKLRQEGRETKILVKDTPKKEGLSQFSENCFFPTICSNLVHELKGP
jgi:hypothetical protein